MEDKIIPINEKNGRWFILERTIKYENKYGLKLYEDKVKRPDGKEGLYGWVEIGGGVNILPIDNNDNIYLGKDFMYPIGAESIEVASGGIESGETPLDAAKRELKEELGVTANEWIDMGIYRPITGRVRSIQYMYIVRGIDLGESKQDSTENIKLIKMPLEEAVKKVMNNEIQEGLTSTLILKAYVLFGKRKNGK